MHCVPEYRTPHNFLSISEYICGHIFCLFVPRASLRVNLANLAVLSLTEDHSSYPSLFICLAVGRFSNSNTHCSVHFLQVVLNGLKRTFFSPPRVKGQTLYGFVEGFWGRYTSAFMFVMSVFCFAGCKFSRWETCGARDQENEVQIFAESFTHIFIYFATMKSSLYCVNRMRALINIDLICVCVTSASPGPAYLDYCWS